jgi:ribosomal protein L16 Arg81 hydroxylase
MHLSFQALLGTLPLARFVAEYYQKLPFSAAGPAQPLCALGTWDAVVRLLAADQADVLVCRRNEQHAGQPPTTAAEAERMVGEGYTLLVRHAERHDARLADVAAAFARDFAAPVNIHVYCTPGGQYGFGWHYDAEEVFIVQTTGRKEYSLRKNTVNPWPIEETLPADMRYEREIMPLSRCALAAGDWLYIPSGYWHMGQSRETAISLAIGVAPHTAVEAFDFLRPQIIHSLLWRQRLPVVGEAADRDDAALMDAYAEIFGQLGADLQKLLANPRQAAAFVEHLRRTKAEPSEPAT